jgi:photosynthetic reaction center cytochrome c subunit
MRADSSVAMIAIAVVVGSCTQPPAGTSAPAPVVTPAPAQQTGAGGPGGPGGPPMTAADSARMAARRDSIAKDREKLYNDELAYIAGRENQPAESVYKNIKLFKGQPAGRVLRIMAQGFDPALGVSCSHCHVAGEYEKEDKPTKQIARDMFAMVTAINTEYLAKIKNLKSPNPVVNCSTCHRGQTRPGAGGPPRPTAAPPG